MRHVSHAIITSWLYPHSQPQNKTTSFSWSPHSTVPGSPTFARLGLFCSLRGCCIPSTFWGWCFHPKTATNPGQPELKSGFAGFPYPLGSGDYHDKSPKSMRLPDFPTFSMALLAVCWSAPGFEFGFSSWTFEWNFSSHHLARTLPATKHHGWARFGYLMFSLFILMVSMWRNLKKPMQSRDSGHPQSDESPIHFGCIENFRCIPVLWLQWKVNVIDKQIQYKYQC